MAKFPKFVAPPLVTKEFLPKRGKPRDLGAGSSSRGSTPPASAGGLLQQGPPGLTINSPPVAKGLPLTSGPPTTKVKKPAKNPKAMGRYFK